MANLSGQNIGTNYKGILNLNTLNGNLTSTLQAVTDGDGNASPLRLSTTSVDINSALTVLNSVTASGGFRSINYNESFQRVGFNNGANYNPQSYILSGGIGIINLVDNTEVNFNRLTFGGTSKPSVCQGSGTPEGAVTAPIGSIFMRSDGGVLSSLYVKQSGTGNTGWAAIA
jgi:hypothetical protein